MRGTGAVPLVMLVMVVMVVCPVLVSFVGASTSTPPVLLSLPLALSLPRSSSLPRSVFQRVVDGIGTVGVVMMIMLVVVLVPEVCVWRVRPATCHHVTVA